MVPSHPEYIKNYTTIRKRKNLKEKQERDVRFKNKDIQMAYNLYMSWSVLNFSVSSIILPPTTFQLNSAIVSPS